MTLKNLLSIRPAASPPPLPANATLTTGLRASEAGEDGASAAPLRVLYVTSDVRDADVIRFEIGRLIPSLQLEAVGSRADALERLPAGYDALVFDTSVPEVDLPGCVALVRSRFPDLAVILLVRPGEPAPIPAIDADADDYLVRGPQLMSRLADALTRTVRQRRADAERRRKPWRVRLVGGNAAELARHLPDPPPLVVEPLSLSEARAVDLPDRLPAVCDAVVIDLSAEGPGALTLVKTLSAAQPDLPIIVLVDPDADDLAAKALKLGAAEAVVKAGRYGARLTGLMARAKQTPSSRTPPLGTSESRLRLIVESVPAAIAVIAGDGTCLAMNLAGLKLAGVTRVDQIVGRNLLQIVAPADRSALQSLLEVVCGGGRQRGVFSWMGGDGAARTLELEAVPLPRGGGQFSVLATLREAPPPGPADLAALQRAIDDAHAAQDRFDDIAAELNAARDEIAAMQTEVEALREESAAERAAREALETALAGAQSRLGALVDEHHHGRAELESTIAQLEAHNHALEETHARQRREWEDTVSRLEHELAALRASQTTTSAIEEARQEADELRARLQEARREQIAALSACDAAQAELSAATHALDEEKARHAATRLELEETRAALEAARTAADQRSAAADELRAALAEQTALAMERQAALLRLEEERDAIGARLTRATSELEALDARHSAEIADLRARLHAAEERCQQLEEQIARPEARPAVAVSGEAASSTPARLFELQVRRGEALGRLATAVSDQLGDGLASLTDLARLAPDSGAGAITPDDADRIQQVIDRARRLAAQLGTFSRKQARPIEPVDLGALIAQAEPALARLVGGDIILLVPSARGVRPAVGDRDDLEQLVHVMTIAARGLLTAGGTVTLDVGEAESDPSWSADLAGELGPSVVLRAAAAGPGILPASASPLLETVAGRCAGRLVCLGDTQRAALKVFLPRHE